MKAHKKILIPAVLLLSISALFCILCVISCGVSTPQENLFLTLDDLEILHWTDIKDVKYYSVSVNDSDYTLKDNYLDLFEVFIDPIEYEIEVYAITNNKKNEELFIGSLTYKPAIKSFSIKPYPDSVYALADKTDTTVGKIVIKSAVMGDNYIAGIEKQGFINDNSVTGIVVLDKDVKIANEYAFAGCTALKRASICCESINKAFYGCTSLQRVDLSENLKVQSDFSLSFAGCSNLSQITFKNGHPYYYSSDNFVLTKEDNALVWAGSQEVLKISPLAQSVGQLAIYANEAKKIYIPGNVKTIDTSGISNCHNLTEVIIEDGLEVVNFNAFFDCPELNTLYLPKSVKTFSGYVFSDCKKLKRVIIAEDNPFFKNDKDCVISIADNALVLWLGKDIPDYIITLKSYSINNCSKTAFTVPSSTKTIKKSAFVDCKFTEVTLPEDLLEISTWAFKRCYDIKAVYLNNGLQKLGCCLGYYESIYWQQAVYHNTWYRMPSLTVPESVQSYGYDKIDKFFQWAYFSAGATNVDISPDISACVTRNCTFGYDGAYPYVYSFVSDENIHNGMPVPARKGYNFLGFSLEENSNVPDYPVVKDIFSDAIMCFEYYPSDENHTLAVPVGTTLYAVWEKL